MDVARRMYRDVSQDAKPEQSEDRRSARREGSLTFGEFRIDLAKRTLSAGGERVPIQRKPLEVLIYLAEQAPRLVSRTELLRRFWSASVNEESLTRCISTIRERLGDGDDPPRVIETHRAQGYRFIAAVARDEPVASDSLRPARYRLPWVSAAAVVGLLLFLVFWSGVVHESPVPPADRIDRIAVLPVGVRGAEAEWLSTALTDQMMRAVSGIEGIKVIAAGSADPAAAPRAAGRRLDVPAVLTSRLEQVPNGSRLSAKLISAHDGSLLWSSSVDSPQALSSDVQLASLARQIAQRLQPTLQLRVASSPVDPAAYRHYLQGRYYWSQRSAVGLDAAISAFDKALEVKPDYVDALVGAAESWLLLPLYGAAAPMSSIPGSRSLAERALVFDASNARARAVLGAIAMQFDWDWSRAEKLLREAVALNPNDATAQQWLGELYCYRGRFDECARQFRIALELDPLSPVLRMQQGSAALYAGNFELALTEYQAAARDNPDFGMGRYVIGLASGGLGDWGRAVSAYRAALPELGTAIVGGPMVYALAKNGDRDQAVELAAELEALAAERYVPPSKLAIAYLGLGERDRAVSWFEQALKVHDDRLVYFGVDVHTRDLAGEPAFAEIAARIGFGADPDGGRGSGRK